MDNKLNICQRINAVMGEVKHVGKEKSQGMQYATVSHDSVTAVLHDSIVKHGIAYYPQSLAAEQDGNRTQVMVTVRFVNIDDPKDFIDVPSLGYGIDQQDKGPGKAISYAVKYALLKTFGLNTGDDPDNDQNVVHEPSGATPAQLKAIGAIMRQRDIDVDEVIEQYGKNPKEMTMSEASRVIKEIGSTKKPWEDDERFNKPVEPAVSLEEINEVIPLEEETK